MKSSKHEGLRKLEKKFDSWLEEQAVEKRVDTFLSKMRTMLQQLEVHQNRSLELIANI